MRAASWGAWNLELGVLVLEDLSAGVLVGPVLELLRVVRDDGRKLFVEAEMAEAGGTVVATATALFLKVDMAHFDRGAPPASIDPD